MQPRMRVWLFCVGARTIAEDVVDGREWTFGQHLGIGRSLL